ncbi:hypothetical protein FJZ55_08305 [Candidatus Woesearchaeota archaeon]|nr:hypothetical protein [Candidatus Woesearchaeota archaeon]
MTTTPPKKSTSTRRKRTVAAATLPPGIAPTRLNVEAEAPEITPVQSLNIGVEAEAPEITPVQPQAEPDTGAPTAEPVCEEQPPLVGEFISREDWAEPPPNTAVPPGQDVRSGEGEEQIIDRVKQLNRNMGWVLISAGVVGIVLPGVIGTPFVILGSLVLWPGNQKLLDKWRKEHRSRFINAALRQVDRYLDDIERRYPSNGKTS